MDNERIRYKSEYNLRDLIILINKTIALLRSKALWISIGVVIFAIVGGVQAYYKDIQYSGKVSFVLEDEKSTSANGLLGFASQFGLDVSGGESVFSAPNLIELMKSRSLVEKSLLTKVSYEGKFTSLADFFASIDGYRKAWDKNDILKRISFSDDQSRSSFGITKDSLLGVLYSRIVKNNLIVGQPDKKIGIIVVDVTSTNQLFSKFFAETLVNVVSDFYIEIKSKKAKSNLDILQYQADSIRSELNSGLSSVAIMGDNTFGLNPALNVKRVPTIKKQIDVQSSTAILNQIVQSLEMAKVTLRKETPLIQVIDKPILPLKKLKPSTMKNAIIYAFIGGIFICLWVIIHNWYHNLKL